jgi:hypothetical protein
LQDIFTNGNVPHSLRVILLGEAEIVQKLLAVRKSYPSLFLFQSVRTLSITFIHIFNAQPASLLTFTLIIQKVSPWGVSHRSADIGIAVNAEGARTILTFMTPVQIANIFAATFA